MKTFYVTYKIGSGQWQNFGPVSAKSSAGAIATAAQSLRDIDAELTIKAEA